MATSMSNAVRNYVGYQATKPTAIYINGTTFVNETFVKVQWWWLSLLIALVAASILFLMATIVKTKLSGVDAMKSNALAAVTILGPEARKHMGPTALQNKTIKRAEGLEVALRKRRNGWSLDPVEYENGRKVS